MTFWLFPLLAFIAGIVVMLSLLLRAVRVAESAQADALRLKADNERLTAERNEAVYERALLIQATADVCCYVEEMAHVDAMVVLRQTGGDRMNDAPMDEEWPEEIEVNR